MSTAKRNSEAALLSEQQNVSALETPLFEAEAVIVPPMFVNIGRSRVKVKPKPTADAELKVSFDFAEGIEIEDIIKAFPESYWPSQMKEENSWSSSDHYGGHKTISDVDEALANGDNQNTRITMRVNSKRVWKVNKAEGYDITYTIWKHRRKFEKGEVEVKIEMKDGKLSLAPTTISAQSREQLDILEPMRAKEMHMTWCYKKIGETRSSSHTETSQVCEPAFGNIGQQQAD